MALSSDEKERINALLDSGEQWDFERSPISLIPQYLILILLVALAVHYSSEYPWLVQRVELLIPLNLSLPALVPLVYAGYLLHRLKDSLYSVRPNQIRSTHGRWSFAKKDTEIDAADVRGVDIRRPLFGRFFNYGNLEIGTAAHQGEEIYMGGIFDPSSVRDIILRRKDQALQAKNNGSGLVGNSAID